MIIKEIEKLSPVYHHCSPTANDKVVCYAKSGAMIKVFPENKTYAFPHVIYDDICFIHETDKYLFIANEFGFSVHSLDDLSLIRHVSQMFRAHALTDNFLCLEYKDGHRNVLTINLKTLDMWSTHLTNVIISELFDNRLYILRRDECATYLNVYDVRTGNCIKCIQSSLHERHYSLTDRYTNC